MGFNCWGVVDGDFEYDLRDAGDLLHPQGEKGVNYPSAEDRGACSTDPAGVPKEHREGGLTVARLGWLIASK